jgi:hypothetical protein
VGRKEKAEYPLYGKVADFSWRKEFIMEKYVERKYLVGEKDVDPWSLSPLRDVEIAVLELVLERPADA